VLVRCPAVLGHQPPTARIAVRYASASRAFANGLLVLTTNVVGAWLFRIEIRKRR
jgi:hypothetical protein